MGLVDTYQAYREFAKKKGMPWIEPGKLVNRVDNKSFNYSLEEPILREFGSYLEISHPYTFSTVQPCIRGGDVSLVQHERTDKHLSLFHIFPTSFFLMPDVKDLEYYHRKSIEDTIEFLVGVGINTQQLEITYFAGGQLDNISNGHIPVSKVFPMDTTTRAAFLAEGLQDHQLKPIASLDTFVATFASDEYFFAGNRFEIYYKSQDGSMLEIGTGEALAYRQIRKAGTTIDILPSPCSITGVVFGIERLQSVLEGRGCIIDISTINELGNALLPFLDSHDDKNKRMAADFFQAVHLILAQTHNKKLNSYHASRRRVLLSQFCRRVINNDLSIQLSDLYPLLEMNAKLHPWLPELQSEMEPVANYIMESLKNRK